uniref:Uncharacterized protein n=1 Tax=Rhizophora mucronata TaxID=61149 RepID=A0A2P2PID5_RHIMU
MGFKLETLGFGFSKFWLASLGSVVSTAAAAV